MENTFSGLFLQLCFCDIVSFYEVYEENLLLFNVLHRRISISRKRKTSLKKYAPHIRHLANVRSHGVAKEVLVQKGTGLFLPLILGQVVSAVASALTQLISK